MPIDKKALGAIIKDIRIQRRETLEEFADSLQKVTKVTRPTKSGISKWERGINMPNPITIEAIAKLGNMTTEELLDRANSLQMSDSDVLQELKEVINRLQPIDQSDNLTREEREIIKQVRELNASDQKTLVDFLTFLIWKNKI
ncbi:MAG: helix-turn-helix transcriptional regulator [Aerococcus sp.]|nr:helix-turn-helix transcriptional regulator [Aerococcus sp.]